MSGAKPLPSGYAMLKAFNAMEAVWSDLAGRAAGGKRLSVAESASVALATFKEVYNKPLTTVMYMAGAAMHPNINKAAQEDSGALEKLVRAAGRVRGACARVWAVHVCSNGSMHNKKYSRPWQRPYNWHQST